MKKVTKKIVALLTVLAFLLTLLPVAAFAAGTASANTSVFATTDDNDTNSGKTTTDKVAAEFSFLTADGAAADTPDNVYVWAVAEGQSTPTDALKVFQSDAAGEATATEVALSTKTAAGALYNTAKLAPANIVGGKIYLQFVRGGKYTVYAGLPTVTTPEGMQDLAKLQMDTNKNVITVNSDEKTVATMTVTDPSAANFFKESKNAMAAGSTDSRTIEVADINAIAGNGIEKQSVTVQLATSASKFISNKVVKLSSNSSNLVLDKTEATTNTLGKFTFSYTAKKAGTYTINIDNGDFTGVLKVKASGFAASSIETIKEPSSPMDVKKLAQNKPVSDDLRFQFKDSKGTVVTPGVEEPAVAGNTDAYIRIVEKPSNVSLSAKNFKLVKDADEKFYRLVYTAADNVELKEGKYTFRVGIEQGATTEGTFEVKKFDKAKELKIEFDVDTVALGDTVTGTAKLVDANGVEREVKSTDEVTFGFNGYAVVPENADVSATDLTVDQHPEQVKIQVKGDDKYLGSKITVTAVSSAHGLVGTTDLIVGQEGSSLKFEETSGPAGSDNKVNFQVVDKDGNSVAPGSNSEVIAYVVSSTNKDAHITVTAQDPSDDLANKGKGYITVTSDKETVAEIAVYVKNAAGRIFANSLTYTFGKEAVDPSNMKNVVMTISSKEVIVNNNIVTIDAAPYVKQNRTFVPIRALVESFGATVDWNDKDRTVTIKSGKKVIVMTVGSTEYTVDGVKATMDVAPTIMSDRTFVPVRFAAEALGYKVTATYNTDGTTASVVFQM